MKLFRNVVLFSWLLYGPYQHYPFSDAGFLTFTFKLRDETPVSYLGDSRRADILMFN